ncbi:MAG: hypothetical protein U1A72_16725 [Sulfuritalea sp.]|nr:hypothetical protein [Sulfuritalea sp.]
MSQLLAMQVRPPQIDLPGIAAAAARTKGLQAQSQLSGLQLRDEQGRSNAVQGYREGLKSGDPDASQALTGYPELEAQFQEAFDSIEDAKEKKKATKRAKALGEAARELSYVPQGPQRQEAAEVVLGRLVKDGTITEEMADQARQTGVTDLFLSQYLSLDQWVQQQFPDEDAALKRQKTKAEISKLEAEAAAIPGERALDQEKLQADIARIRAQTKETSGKGDRSDRKMLLDIEKAVTKFRETIDPFGRGRDEIEQRVNDHKAELVRNLMGRGASAQGRPSPQAEDAMEGQPVRKRFRNPETGEEQVFEVRDGQWVPVTE